MKAFVVALCALWAASCGHAGPPQALPNGDYRLALAALDFEVAPGGARVVDVRLPGGANLLTGPDVDPLNFGSTFWTSPQSAWPWPPPAAFDTAPFAVGGSADRLAFTGPPDPTVGAQIVKQFSAGPTSASIDIRYQITAVGAGGLFAPWEITRVFPGGLTFFPTGGDSPRAGGGFALPPTRNAAGCTWYQHPGTPPGGDQKLLADGAGGWLAQVAGRVVLVKTFPDVPLGKTAPGEAEIEIFVDGKGRYVEVEEQGAYQALRSGQTLAWPVTWIVRALPDGLNASAGSPDLVAFVQRLVTR
jgi:hypothetical protein